MTAEEAFKRLDLRPGASPGTVHTMYKRLAQDVHPDRGGDATAFHRLREAYDIAKRFADEEPCPSCDGSKTKLHMQGWQSCYVDCPACLSHPGRKW